MKFLVKQDAKFNRRTLTYNFPSDARNCSEAPDEKMIWRNYEKNTIKINIQTILYFNIMILTQ